MHRRFRHRLTLPRASWLLLMAVAFVWQPALLAAAEAHERMHTLGAGEHPHGGHDVHAAAGHAAAGRAGAASSADVDVSHDHDHGLNHDDRHHPGHDPDSSADAGNGRESVAASPGGGLHALLHAMHCCGHPSALPALMLASVLPAPGLVPPATANAGRPGPLLADPLRPPIAG